MSIVGYCRTKLFEKAGSIEVHASEFENTIDHG
jgi:hypothetical protein